MRTPLPIHVAAPAPESGGRSWVLPGVLGLSVGVHGALLVLSALLPSPPVGVQAEPTELAFQILAPEPEVVEPEVVEPEVIEPEPAAIVARPQPSVRPAPPEPAVEREVVEPEVVEREVVEPEAPAEPPPPAPVMVASAEGGSAGWDHPAGEEGGQLGGTPGGQGTGAVAPEGPIAVAPPQPRGISRAELRRRLLGYMRGTLWGFVNGRIDYPLAARRSNVEGVVMLRIRLDRDGRLLNVRLAQSSGHQMLDRAALASVQRLDAMPAPPDSIPWDAGQELPLPVTYQLVR